MRYHGCPRWDTLEWFDIFQLYCCPESEAKSHPERSIWHCARCAADILYMKAMHAIRLGSALWCHISFYGIIFLHFFFFLFSFCRPEEMVGFTFHCLFKYSFNLVNVLASGVQSIFTHRPIGCVVGGIDGVIRHRRSTRAHNSHRRRAKKKKKNDRKYLLSQIDEIASVLVSLNGLRANACSQSYHILLNHFVYRLFAFASNWCTPI